MGFIGRAVELSSKSKGFLSFCIFFLVIIGLWIYFLIQMLNNTDAYNASITFFAITTWLLIVVGILCLSALSPPDEGSGKPSIEIKKESVEVGADDEEN